MLQSGHAPPALAATQHGVPGDPSAQPGRVDPVTSGRHGAAPFVPQPHRIPRETLVQIGHLTGVELDIGTADADPLDIHDDFAGAGNRRRHLLHPGFAWTSDDERPQRAQRVI